MAGKTKKRTVASWREELDALRADRDRCWLALTDVLTGREPAGRPVKASVTSQDGESGITGTIYRPDSGLGGILLLLHRGPHNCAYVEVHAAEEWLALQARVGRGLTALLAERLQRALVN